jgi:phosphoribosylformimino-5-aminoimidazole carboxamide ribotide isomerase
MQVIPSLDIRAGRSRLVWWPGAATGSGTPTDRPERICETLVDLGAPVLHLVDLDGATRGRPVNLEVIAAVARTTAVPLQVAGGLDGPEQIEIAFAAGATRVVVPLWSVAEDRARLAACLAVAGGWLAVGLDARPERLRGYPWRGHGPPTLDGLVAELDAAGVRRFVLSHLGTQPPLERLAGLRAVTEGELAIAGGITSVAAIGGLRGVGVDAVILGEPLFTGALDYPSARAAAA